MVGVVRKRQTRSRSIEEKISAIRRVRNGESKVSVARSMDVPESTLRGWCKNEERITYLSQYTTSNSDRYPEPYSRLSRPTLQYSSMEPLNLCMRNLRVSTPEVSPRSGYNEELGKNSSGWNFMWPSRHSGICHKSGVAPRFNLHYSRPTISSTVYEARHLFAAEQAKNGFHHSSSRTQDWVRSVRYWMEEQLVREGNAQQNAGNLAVGEFGGTTSGRVSEEEHFAKGRKALEQGEKFLKWLQDASDPTVTMVHLGQFRTLLNDARSAIQAQGRGGPVSRIDEQ